MIYVVNELLIIHLLFELYLKNKGGKVFAVDSQLEFDMLWN